MRGGGSPWGSAGSSCSGCRRRKDEIATGAYDEDGIVQNAIRAIKRESSPLLVMTDVCNCEYTSHGHCGYVENGDVDNDTTLDWLATSALSHARAGADIVAPSDMMDGRVGRSGRRWTRTGSSDPDSVVRGEVRVACSTDRSGRRPNPRRSSGTGGATRWTRRTGARRCARSNWIWRKAPT